MTPEELDVFGAASPETHNDASDPYTNEDDPRQEERPSARQENGEQSGADERNDCQHDRLHRRKLDSPAMSGLGESAYA